MSRREFVGITAGVIGYGLGLGYLGYTLGKKNSLVENVVLNNSITNPSNTIEQEAGIYFNPLQHIYAFDQFSKGGLRGWAKYGDGIPKIGQLIAPEGTTQGGLTGETVLVIPSDYYSEDCWKGKGCYSAKAIKRMSWIWKKRIRWESWLVWKSKNNLRDQEDFGWFSFDIDTQMGFDLDLQDRRFYRIRWLNYDGNNFRREWQYDAGIEIEPDWRSFPGDPIQELTCNCTNTNRKYDWLYTRMDIDLGKRKYVEFQCADRIWKIDQSPSRWEKSREWDKLNNLLNFGWTVQTRIKDTTAYLYIDSTLISAEE